MTWGEFRVIGNREYRGHRKGDVFEMQFTNAAVRAMNRNDIELLRPYTPGLQPGCYTFPEGWLQPESSPSSEARTSGSLS